jgi:DNA-binding LacI/PurR family transcriptional regulator
MSAPPINQNMLAKSLGVSQGTVSIALGGAGRISERTRARVLERAAELGYTKNPMAMGLRGKQTKSVGLIWDYADPWTSDSIIALDFMRDLQRQEFVVYQMQHDEGVDALVSKLDELLLRQVDSLIVRLIPDELADPEVRTRVQRFPSCLAVTRQDLPDYPADLVIHDRNRAIREVVEHFSRIGRHRVGFAIATEQESNRSKVDCFQRCCREFGLEEHANEIIPLPFPHRPEAVGERHLQGFNERFPEGGPVALDAIFCFNDIGAMYIGHELRRRGLTVPDQIALVGFNDNLTAEIWSPPLASGSRRPREVSDTLAELFRRRLGDRSLPYQRRHIPMQFVWRESAGGPPHFHKAKL